VELTLIKFGFGRAFIGSRFYLKILVVLENTKRKLKKKPL